MSNASEMAEALISRLTQTWYTPPAHAYRDALPAVIAPLLARAKKAERERDEARRAIQATHRRAIKHKNCRHEPAGSCPICDGGLFVCADCGAAEAEAEEQVCTGPEARAEAAAVCLDSATDVIARLKAAVDGARALLEPRHDR